LPAETVVAWVKAFHIIFVVTWFAGLFYLPRLFVYHSAGDLTPREEERFRTMERRLYAITTLGGTLAVGFGLWLLFGWFWPPPFWLRLKLVLVALLVVYHISCGVMVRRFARGTNRRPPVFYRLWNEIPSLFLIAIVLLAVLRPDRM
jgi:putative membrane protein